nr:hypothetical protein BaRGS_021455 [Batillaria attramentaria]
MDHNIMMRQFPANGNEDGNDNHHHHNNNNNIRRPIPAIGNEEGNDDNNVRTPNAHIPAAEPRRHFRRVRRRRVSGQRNPEIRRNLIQ